MTPPDSIGELTAALESIDRRLFTLPADTLVLPGHGSDTTIANDVQNGQVAIGLYPTSVGIPDNGFGSRANNKFFIQFSGFIHHHTSIGSCF